MEKSEGVVEAGWALGVLCGRNRFKFPPPPAFPPKRDDRENSGVGVDRTGLTLFKPPSPPPPRSWERRSRELRVVETKDVGALVVVLGGGVVLEGCRNVVGGTLWKGFSWLLKRSNILCKAGCIVVAVGFGVERIVVVVGVVEVEGDGFGVEPKQNKRG